MNAPWQTAVERQLNSEIVEKSRLGGGDFAESYQALLSDGRNIFVKTHSNPPARFFTTEAKGLQWLSAADCVNVPTVLAYSDTPPFLALEWVSIGHRGSASEQLFGQQLAQLHQAGFDCFGRPDECSTGSQAVPNAPCDSWVEFYATQRLLPLARKAFDAKALSSRCIAQIEHIASILDTFEAADEPPALLHGDVWAGNRVVDQSGNSWLIDPAAHGGHREFDLAMMRLFGGYDDTCFAAYNEHFPLQSDWQHRVALHQLAPLMVHAIKFGGAYRASTEQAVALYV